MKLVSTQFPPAGAKPTAGPTNQPGLRRPERLQAQLKADIVEVEKNQAERIQSKSRLSKLFTPIKNFFSGLLDKIKSLGAAIQSKLSRKAKEEKTVDTQATELISKEEAAKVRGKTTAKSTKAKPEKFVKGSVFKGITRMIQKSFSLRGIAAWAVAILTGFTVPLPLKYFLEGFLGYSSLVVNRKYSRLPMPFSHVVTSNKGIDTRSALSAWRTRK